MTGTKSEAMTFDEWWTEWNRCRCGISDHARMSASNAWYRQQHVLEGERAKHERVLQMLELAVAQLQYTQNLFKAEDLDNSVVLSMIAHEIAQIESLKK